VILGRLYQHFRHIVSQVVIPCWAEYRLQNIVLQQEVGTPMGGTSV
jgi:hypothetical protein